MIADTNLHVQAESIHTLGHTCLPAKPQSMTATSFDGIVKSRRRRDKCFGRGIYLRSLLCGLAESSKCFRHSLKSTLTQYGCNFRNDWMPTIAMPFYISELTMYDMAWKKVFSQGTTCSDKNSSAFFFGFVLLSKFNFPGRHSDAEV